MTELKPYLIIYICAIIVAWVLIIKGEEKWKK